MRGKEIKGITAHELKSTAGKLLVLVLCITLAFGLMACGSKGNDSEEPEPAGTEEPAATEDEGTLEINVNPGLEEIAEADWGVCYGGTSVQFDLGMDVKRDWTMKPTLDRIDTGDLEAQKSVLQEMMEKSLSESSLGTFQLTTAFEKMEMSEAEAKEKGLRKGDALSCSGFENEDQNLMSVEAGVYYNPQEEDHFQYTRMDSRNYTLAEDADIPEICRVLEEEYGVIIDPERLEKGLKETYDRAAYYIVPENLEYNVEINETEIPDEDIYGEGGTYSCSVEQTANVQSNIYSEKVTVRIFAQQIQIGEANMRIRVERSRNYKD